MPAPPAPAPAPDAPAARHARTPRAHLRAVVALALVASLGLAGCHISWQLRATHGAIIEPAAGRASVGIYRAPTRALGALLSAKGTDVVQDVLCASGRFPVLSLRVGRASVSADLLTRRWCGYVHGDDADLRGALREARAQRDCLALTLISNGLYIKNWTHKSTGCKEGSL